MHPSSPPTTSLSPRQARQLVETAYLASATALLWAGLYYLPVGEPCFDWPCPSPWPFCRCVRAGGPVGRGRWWRLCCWWR